MHNNEEYLNIANGIKNIDELKDKSFLITGATGLIGSYFVDFLIYLNKEYSYNIKIYATSRAEAKLEKRFNKNDINIIEQDLSLPFNSNIKFDYIIHAASNAHPLAFSNDPVGTMKTNIIGTMNLLDMIKNDSTKFLYVSSGEVYGNNIDRDFVETDIGLIDTTQVRSCYPEAKRACETICMSYKQQYNIHVNIARLCYIYGPTITDENSRADAQFLRKALNKEDIVMKSEGKQKRTYCYVADTISGLLYILLNGENGEVYNIANPNSIVSIKEYAQTLADIVGVELKFELPDDIEKRGYSKPADSRLDSSKLRNLGWKPIYDIQEGLKTTIRCIKGEYNDR